MALPTSAVASVDSQFDVTLRRLGFRLQLATLRLCRGASEVDVRAARSTMEEAERVLAGVINDPWAPLIALEVRSILSSHLLAADACISSDADAAVTTRVLRQGADSAQRRITEAI